MILYLVRSNEPLGWKQLRKTTQGKGKDLLNLRTCQTRGGCLLFQAKSYLLLFIAMPWLIRDQDRNHSKPFPVSLFSPTGHFVKSSSGILRTVLNPVKCTHFFHWLRGLGYQTLVGCLLLLPSCQSLIRSLFHTHFCTLTVCLVQSRER